MNGLRIDDVCVRFGGLTAVRSVSLEAPLGSITGLIGPNGAGKTTIFNVCSALATPASGTVELCGVDITRLAPQRRAQLGLGRTFQRMELFDSLSVIENVRLGREARLAGSRAWSQLFSSRGDEATISRAAEEALATCGIAALADVCAGDLSTGQRRLVELARVLAGDFAFLLLDEPSSGLDSAETARFGRVLRDVCRTRGVGILLVEHDMSLVLSICELVHVMEFGRLIFRGSPDEVRASAVVRAAYLGSDSAISTTSSKGG